MESIQNCSRIYAIEQYFCDTSVSQVFFCLYQQVPTITRRRQQQYLHTPSQLVSNHSSSFQRAAAEKYILLETSSTSYSQSVDQPTAHEPSFALTRATKRCPYCPYSTAFSTNLKRHLLSHTGEKPFACSICQYRCRQKIDLRRHMVTHSREVTPLRCSLCTYVPIDKTDLDLHNEKIHCQ